MRPLNLWLALLPFVVFLLVVEMGVEAKKGRSKVKIRTITIDSNERRKEIDEMVADVVKGGKLRSRPDLKRNKLRKGREIQGPSGNKHTRLVQEYDGVPVFGAVVVNHVIRGGLQAKVSKRTRKVVGYTRVRPRVYTSGQFVDDIYESLGVVDAAALQRQRKSVFDRVAKLKAKSAKRIQKIKNDLNDRMTLIRNRFSTRQNGRSKRATAGFGDEDESKMDRSDPMIFIDENGVPHIAYRVKFWETDPLRYPHIIYDADTHTILKEWDGLQDLEASMRQRRAVEVLGKGPGGNKKIGKYYYGSNNKPLIPVNKVGGTCVLDSGTVRTINYRQQETVANLIGHNYSCPTHDSDEVNDGYSPMNDAHYHANVIVDMYKKWYKTTPIANTATIIIKAHYKNEMDNAYWDGEGLLLGDGKTFFYPLTALDVIAHEIAHGTTEFSSGLIYDEQSGGLNEAFSDMAGRTAVRFLKGYDAATFDWRIGAEVTKLKPQLRCMDNPTCDGVSIDHISKYTPGLSVHKSSGIFNRVFVLMAKALPYNLWDAFDIMYIANTRHWGPLTDFRQGAALVMKAAEELKAGDHFEWDYPHINLNVLKDIFRQVGIICEKTTVGKEWKC